MSGNIDLMPGKKLANDEPINASKLMQVLLGVQLGVATGAIAKRELRYDMLLILETLTELAAHDVSKEPDNTQVFVSGYASVGDGGGGIFTLDRSGTLGANAEDSGTIFYAKDGKLEGAEDKGYWRRQIQPGYTDAKWFGAKGDGVSDDTAVFSNLLEHMKEHPGVLYFPAGTYVISSTVAAQDLSYCTIRGERGSTIIDGTSFGSQSILIEGTDVSNFAEVNHDIEKGDTSITLSTVTGLEVGDLLYLRSTEVFHDDRTNPWRKEEMHVVDAISVGSKIVTLRTGVNYDYTNAGNAIMVDRVVPVREVHFEGITFRKNTHRSVRILGFKDCSFTDCVVDGGEAGLWLNRGMNGRIDKCRVDNCRLGAGYGLYLSSVQGGAITNSHGYDNRHSVEVAGSSKDIVVSGNWISGDVAAGISSHGGTDRITFESNHVHSCFNGIYARGRSSTIADNVLKGIGFYGIQIGETTSGELLQAGINLRITGNLIERSSRAAMQFNAPVIDADISGNTCEDCIWNVGSVMAVLWFRKGGRNTTISRNKINGSQDKGIQLNPTGVRADPEGPPHPHELIGIKVLDNHIADCATLGIYLSPNSGSALQVHDITITGNTIERCDRGFTILNERRYSGITLADNNFRGNRISDTTIENGVWMEGHCLLRASTTDRVPVRITEGNVETDLDGMISNHILFRTGVEPVMSLTCKGNYRAFVQSYNVSNNGATGLDMFTGVNIKVLDGATGDPAPEGVPVNIIVR